MRRFITGLAAMAALVSIDVSPAHSQEVIRLCTGSETGNYYKAGEMIASFNPNVQVVATNGTWDNIRRTYLTPAESPEACDAMIGQPDGAAILKRDQPQYASKMLKVGDLHREYLHVICNKASGVDDLSDLEGNNKYSIAVGAEGSGGWLIWQNFIFEDSDYDQVVPKNLGGIEAIADVASGNTTCMLAPAGIRNGTVVEAGELFGEDLILVDAQDKDFNDAADIDGKPLYSFSEIPGDAYEESFTSGWGGSVDTVSWNAAVYANVERLSSQQRPEFIRAVANGKKQAVASFGG